MIYTVKTIEEDIDFGCEERPYGLPVMAVVTLTGDDGQSCRVRIPDKDLYAQDINEGDKVLLSSDGRLVKAFSENDELFDVCDDQGIPTGEIVARSVAHKEDILHRTSHIWISRIKDGKRQVLLQKRSIHKDSFPGLYDTSSAGHILAGAKPLESAIRELHEELGIAADASQLKFAGNFRIHYAKEFYGSMFRDNEVVFVYVYDAPVDIKDIVIQEEELECVEWFDLDEVYKGSYGGRRDKFCVPTEGLEVLMHYFDM